VHQSLAVRILNEILVDDCQSEWVKPLSKMLCELNLSTNVEHSALVDIQKLISVALKVVTKLNMFISN